MDTFYAPIDIAQTSVVNAVPSGYLRLQPKPDGILYARTASGDTPLGAPIATPTLIASGASSTVATNTQMLYAEEITVDGDLNLDGCLTEVS